MIVRMNHANDQEYDVEIENLREVPRIDGPWFENRFMCDMFRIKYEDTSVRLRSDWSDVLNKIKPSDWVTFFILEMTNKDGDPIAITFSVSPGKVKGDYMYFNVKRWVVFDPTKLQKEEEYYLCR